MSEPEGAAAVHGRDAGRVDQGGEILGVKDALAAAQDHRGDDPRGGLAPCDHAAEIRTSRTFFTSGGLTTPSRSMRSTILAARL